MNTKFYQDEKTLLRIGAQFLILFVLGFIIAARGSLSMRPLDVIALLAFNLLVWGRIAIAAEPPWLGVHLYLALQNLLAFWLFTQELIFGYLFYIPYAQAIILIPHRGKLVWMILSSALFLGGNYYLHPDTDVVVTMFTREVLGSAIFVFVTLMMVNIVRARRDEKEIRHLLAELSHAYYRLQEQAEQVEVLAASEERNRISRDLHDALGHRLTAAIVQTEGALRLLGQQKRQRATKMFENVHEQLCEGLHELRATLHALRTPEVTGGNLTHALQQMADAFAAATNITIHTRLTDALPPSLSDAQYETIYRVAQEALTNTEKHARAQNIRMALDSASNALILTVRNDGLDFYPSNGEGYGLQGMRERASQLGGTLHVTKPPEGGTLLTLSLPRQTEMKRSMSEKRLTWEPRQ